MTMLKLPLLIAAMTALIFAAGCAAAGESRGGGDLRQLTRAEIEASSGRNALEIIRQLRPRWLQSRGDRSFGAIPQTILIYYNEARLGSPADALPTISKESIARMQWLDSSQAARLPGSGVGHVEAAIMIYSHDWDG